MPSRSERRAGWLRAIAYGIAALVEQADHDPDSEGETL